MIIRLTWQRLYRDVPVTTRFVLANPGPLWAPLIEAENATYGDLVVLPHLEESRAVANSIKAIEFFKWMTGQSRRYLFVSKLDDDSFINARAFYNSYLAPRIDRSTGSTELKAGVKRTAFGRRLSLEDFDYPGGQFYTVTWDLLELLVKLQRRLNVTDMAEDALVGHLLQQGNETWNLIQLPNPVAFDYSDEDMDRGTAWAVNSSKQEEWVHAVGPGAINPHKMKDDMTYLRVSNCFDWRGLKSFKWKL
jgi:beta-1,3-galactosyltransferase 1